MPVKNAFELLRLGTLILITSDFKALAIPTFAQFVGRQKLRDHACDISASIYN
jgi:Tfp pilus assembly protein FimT